MIILKHGANMNLEELREQVGPLVDLCDTIIYVEEDREMHKNLKIYRWVVYSFVLCKLNGWYTNDYIELEDISFTRESYQGAIVELVSKSNCHKDIVKLTYDKLFLNIIDNLFNEIDYDKSNIILFDLKSVFKLVYYYYIDLKNNILEYN